MQDIQKVVRLCQDGQLDAFSALFSHFQNRVYDLACTILRDENAAEDVARDEPAAELLREAGAGSSTAC